MSIEIANLDNGQLASADADASYLPRWQARHRCIIDARWFLERVRSGGNDSCAFVPFRRAFKSAQLRVHLRLGAIPPLRKGVRLDP